MSKSWTRGPISLLGYECVVMHALSYGFAGVSPEHAGVSPAKTAVINGDNDWALATMVSPEHAGVSPAKTAVINGDNDWALTAVLLPSLKVDINGGLQSFNFLMCYVLVQWTFHPFILKSKKVYTVLVWCRVLAFLVGSKLATLPRPDSVHEVLFMNFRGVLYGCGDLIFSSHMIFSLVFVRTYQKYGTRRFIKQCAWLTVVLQSFLIIASRKHYTVDVVVAWYTVNLVVFFIDHKLPEMPDRTGGAALLLPLSKDGRTKEENHKLLNGNSGDPVDWRLRTPVNGKILEDGNNGHADSVMNGV
ncbi:hypothetical protein TEA_028235 [Camellia sinensis var. sinensis]|uniref:Sphingomyelin synthase-like domain-containing protein n=1 Tax=Camellia sinensis var. sinensis TaxID=542762 RepID=A0A4S4E342_CAMSN|nr:hypothetical protein TEA_028235 [Camellia sinensis var. sinensis]